MFTRSRHVSSARRVGNGRSVRHNVIITSRTRRVLGEIPRRVNKIQRTRLINYWRLKPREYIEAIAIYQSVYSIIRRIEFETMENENYKSFRGDIREGEGKTMIERFHRFRM